MCFFIQMFFDLCDGLRDGAIRALLVQALETGEHAAGQHRLFGLNVLDQFVLRLLPPDEVILKNLKCVRSKIPIS